jgi:glycine betaine/proline transport system substrate-binding protein
MGDIWKHHGSMASLFLLGKAEFVTKRLGMLLSLAALMLIAVACKGDAIPTPSSQDVIKFHHSQLGTLWVHNAIAIYIIQKGYQYPVEEVQGTVETMQVSLPVGGIHVAMEGWRINSDDWYDKHASAKGTVVDLAGFTDSTVSLPAGSPGQILVRGGQGFYVPTYLIKGDPAREIEATAPDLVSVFDLFRYVPLFQDPKDPNKGLMVNCIVGWKCQKINRAKWAAYGLNDAYNIIEPSSGAALDGVIQTAYEAGEAVLAHYREPTALLSQNDMTRLEEPSWSQKCQDELDGAVENEPFNSEVGCGYPFGDVHVLVHQSLQERAPEVTAFLSKVFVGAQILIELESWKEDNDMERSQVGIKYLRDNESTWTDWIAEPDVLKRVKAALATEAGSP